MTIINIEALKYYHRLRKQGFSHDASRNATLSVFSANFEDWARRTQRYIGMPMYPEFMKFGIDDAEIISLGSEGDLILSLDRKANRRIN